MKEAIDLVKVGFHYHVEIDGVKLFRKANKFGRFLLFWTMK